MSDHPIPDDAWRTIVQYMPIPSVDLLVVIDGGLLLGRRKNEPVQGEWFVPGGTVMKNEGLDAAVQRVATEELGTGVDVLERLGTYEHFYDTADVDGVSSKHYVATAFVVDPESTDFRPDDQHSEFRIFRPPFDDLHPYVRRYATDLT
jgi:colanic acid biosynthesis protein WcaH